MRVKVTGEVVGRPLRNGNLQNERTIPRGDYTVTHNDDMGVNTSVFVGEGRSFVVRESAMKTARALGRLTLLPERSAPLPPTKSLTDAVDRLLAGESVDTIVWEALSPETL